MLSHPIRVRLLGSLDLSMRQSRLINNDRTQTLPLKGFTKTMRQTLNHGQGVSVTGALGFTKDNKPYLTIQSIQKI